MSSSVLRISRISSSSVCVFRFLFGIALRFENDASDRIGDQIARVPARADSGTQAAGRDVELRDGLDVYASRARGRELARIRRPPLAHEPAELAAVRQARPRPEERRV